MGLFRRAKGICPLCGKQKQADIGEKHPKAKKWNLTCSNCGTKFTVKVESAWWIFFRDDNGRLRRRRIGQSKRAAGRVLSKVRVEIAEGRYINRKATCKVTLGVLMDDYMVHTRSVRRKWSRTSEKSTWKHLLEFFGRGVLIDKIGVQDIESYRRKREGDGAAVATINRELSNLSGALSWAVRNGIIDKKPHVKMPNPHNERERFLSKKEAIRLISYCPPTIRPCIQAALFTGMRRGELLQMEWSWVDLQSRMIKIPPTATKNGRRRHVPISDNMYQVLRDSRKRSIEGCALVFHLNGETLPRNKLEETWRRAIDKAGFKGLRIHDLRHSAASWMVMGGEDLYTVATILGHRSLEMTQRYSHLAPDHLKAAIRHVDLEQPNKERKVSLVSGKVTKVSPPKVIEEDRTESVLDGPSMEVNVDKFLRKGMGLNSILNEMIRQALESNGFNQKATARELRISRSALIARMKRYGIPKYWRESIPSAERTYTKGTTLKQVEEAIIRQALEANGFDKASTRRALGISRSTLASKMARYKIAQAQVEKITEETPKNVHLLFTSGNPPPGSASECARNPLLTEGETGPGLPPQTPQMFPHTTQSANAATR